MLELLSLPIDGEQTNTVHSLESFENTADYLIELARLQYQHPELTPPSHLFSFSTDKKWSNARWSSRIEQDVLPIVLAVNVSDDAFMIAIRSQFFRASLIRDKLPDGENILLKYNPDTLTPKKEPISDERLQKFGRQLDISVGLLRASLPEIEVEQVA
jgi:hypothetical protein